MTHIVQHMILYYVLGARDQCPLCHKQMVRNNIHKHIRVKHSQEEPSQCPQCGKAFSISYYMREHLRKVHGIGQRPALHQ